MTLRSMQFSNITFGKLAFAIFVVFFSSTLAADQDHSSLYLNDKLTLVR